MAGNNFDVTVIGGGPGGYVAAIRAAQLGLNVALVEKRETLGGTCLNVGCIPSKALLHSSHLYEAAGHEFAAHGVKAGKVDLDLKVMMAHKDGVVGNTIKGVDFLMKKNKITRIVGAGIITKPGEVQVTPVKGKAETITSKNIIIATGSDVAPLAGVDIDEKQIISSTGALELSKVPKKMIVVGAGVIGLELGSVWRRLGAEVTVVEFLDTILPGMDGEVCKTMQRLLKGQGMDIRLKSKVTGAKAAKTGVSLTVEPVDGGAAETMKADVVLVAIGRRPYTDGLGLENAGIELDRGFIPVDGHLQTKAKGVYAIGDVIGGLMLAHKAEEEGVAVAETLAGQAGHVNYDAIPGIVYTSPEVAGLGKTEEQLKDAGIAYNAGKFPFMANARARAIGETDGFVKILADKETDEVLGVHIVGPAAGDLIQECVVAMEFGGSAEDIARSCHGHPGLSEVVKEAALAVAGRALHM
ncbi:MAG: dihydrolipoyl dehydrogenase [Rhodospirillales bacterium]|nr:dihydrolipoyl dehydrogenase [Rhodospirillaceae bacterium]MDP6428813.1 dihydrolipoyl dehydrogenase [Rhodospirillales bacterium]